MYDIVHDKPEVLKKCQELGIKPLVIGKDVLLVKDNKELKKAAATIVLGMNSERPFIELPIDGVVEIEDSPKKDKMHSRRAGLDQVSGKILAEKAYVVSYSNLRHSKWAARIIGRILQNISVCRKCKTPIIFASFAEIPNDLPAPKDHEAFWRAMGVPEEVTRKNQETFSQWVSKAKHRASDKYIAEGYSKK